MGPPEKLGARAGLASRQAPDFVAGKADEAEHSDQATVRQQRLLSLRFSFPPHVAELIAHLAFGTSEGRA